MGGGTCLGVEVSMWVVPVGVFVAVVAVDEWMGVEGRGRREARGMPRSPVTAIVGLTHNEQQTDNEIYPDVCVLVYRESVRTLRLHLYCFLCGW